MSDLFKYIYCQKMKEYKKYKYKYVKLNKLCGKNYGICIEIGHKFNQYPTTYYTYIATVNYITDSVNKYTNYIFDSVRKRIKRVKDLLNMKIREKSYIRNNMRYRIGVGYDDTILIKRYRYARSTIEFCVNNERVVVLYPFRVGGIFNTTIRWDEKYFIQINQISKRCVIKVPDAYGKVIYDGVV